MSTIILHGQKDLITKAKEKVQSPQKFQRNFKDQVPEIPWISRGRLNEIIGVVFPHRINSVKVVRIRRQLANGSYDIDERLDMVLDDILKDINS